MTNLQRALTNLQRLNSQLQLPNYVEPGELSMTVVNIYSDTTMFQKLLLYTYFIRNIVMELPSDISKHLL